MFNIVHVLNIAINDDMQIIMCAQTIILQVR